MKSMRTLVSWLKTIWPRLIGAALLHVFGVVGSNVVLAFTIRYLIDAFDLHSWDMLITGWILLGVNCVIIALAMGASRYFMGALMHEVMNRVRREVYGHCLELNYRYFDSEEASEIHSVLINDTRRMGESLTNQLPVFASAAVGVVVAAGILATWNLPVVALVMAMAGLALYANSRFSAPMEQASEAEQKKLSQVMTEGAGVASGLQVIKSLGAEDRYQRRFDSSVDEHLKAVRQRGRVEGLMSLTRGLTGSGMFLWILELFAGLMAFAGRVTPGVAMGIAQLGSQVMSPVTQVTQAWNKLHEGAAAARRVEAILQQPVDSAELDTDRDEFPDLSRSPVSIRLQDLTFSYDGSQEVLKDVEVEAGQGEVVALVGASGSGKSTIFKLLLGFYRDYLGSIYVDEKELLREDVLSSETLFSYCPQDLQLFDTSISENLQMVLEQQYGSVPENENKQWMDSYPQRVADILEAFRLPQMVSNLDNGWQSRVSELSGGQRQRIAVARSFLYDTPAVLLDEPTSHLDIGNERIIYESIRNLLGNRTVLFATHRVIHLDWVDKIYVFEQGEVVQKGTMEEIIECKEGVFFELYQQQARMVGTQ